MRHIPNFFQSGADCFGVDSGSASLVQNTIIVHLQGSESSDRRFPVGSGNSAYHIQNTAFFFFGGFQIFPQFLLKNLLFCIHSHNATTVTGIMS